MKYSKHAKRTFLSLGKPLKLTHIFKNIDFTEFSLYTYNFFRHIPHS